MSDDIVENLKRPSVWLRILFMIGFAVALYITAFILLVLVVAQILFALFSGANNDNLRRFGAALTEYIHQILLYLTFNSEQRPFPFAPFPLLEMSDTADTFSNMHTTTNAQTMASAHAGSSVQTASDPTSAAAAVASVAAAPDVETNSSTVNMPASSEITTGVADAGADMTISDTADTNAVTTGAPANREENPIDDRSQHDDSLAPDRPSSG